MAQCHSERSEESNIYKGYLPIVRQAESRFFAPTAFLRKQEVGAQNDKRFLPNLQFGYNHIRVIF